MSVRDLLKSMFTAIATILVVPALLSYWIRRPVLGANRALEGSSQSLSLIPGLVGQYLRRAFLQHVLAHCASTATIEFGTIFSQAGARIDANAYVGPRCHIGLVHIERDVLIAAAVHIPSGAHTHDTRTSAVLIRDQVQHRRVVRIGAGSWIGSAAVVMADIGSNTVVGAGAVVTKPLEDNVLAAGVPAHVVKRRMVPDAERSVNESRAKRTGPPGTRSRTP